jgi:hypothetical protein
MKPPVIRASGSRCDITRPHPSRRVALQYRTQGGRQNHEVRRSREADDQRRSRHRPTARHRAGAHRLCPRTARLGAAGRGPRPARGASDGARGCAHARRPRDRRPCGRRPRGRQGRLFRRDCGRRGARRNLSRTQGQPTALLASGARGTPRRQGARPRARRSKARAGAGDPGRPARGCGAARLRPQDQGCGDALAPAHGAGGGGARARLRQPDQVAPVRQAWPVRQGRPAAGGAAGQEAARLRYRRPPRCGTCRRAHGRGAS